MQHNVLYAAPELACPSAPCSPTRSRPKGSRVHPPIRDGGTRALSSPSGRAERRLGVFRPGTRTPAFPASRRKPIGRVDRAARTRLEQGRAQAGRRLRRCTFPRVPATVKQRRAAFRMGFDRLAIGRVLASNPVGPVLRTNARCQDGEHPGPLRNENPGPPPVCLVCHLGRRVKRERGGEAGGLACGPKP